MLSKMSCPQASPSRTTLAVTLIALLCLPAAASAVSPAEAILAEMPFTEAERKRILAGELVTAGAEETSDRELAVVMAFLIKDPPADLVERFRKATGYDVDKEVTSHGELGGGGLADLQAMTLTPNGDAEAKRYLEAKGGEDLNLSSAEIAAFQALGDKTKPAVEDQLRKLLLARLQAYKSGGLAGIAPYDRGGGKTRSPADDLRKAIQAARVLAKEAPAFQAVLLSYPNSKPAGLEESFYWVNFEIDERPTISLTHRLAMPLGEGAFVIADRHYYVSRSHNALQAVAAVFPAQQGSIVFYGNRTSTDQAAGFGSSAKHKIGRRIMGGQIAAFFEQVRAGAAGK